MPWFDTNSEIEIDVEEFVTSCDKKEIKELINVLIDEGHLNPEDQLKTKENSNLFEIEWLDMLKKLVSLRLQISKEEEETIRNIVKKY